MQKTGEALRPKNKLSSASSPCLRTSSTAAMSSSFRSWLSLAICSPFSKKFWVACSTDTARTWAFLERPFFLLDGPLLLVLTRVVTWGVTQKKKETIIWLSYTFRRHITHKCNIWTKQSVPVSFGLWSSAAIYLFIYLYYSQKVRDAQLSYRISQCTLNTQWPLHVNLFHLLKTFVCTCPVFLQRGD